MKKLLRTSDRILIYASFLGDFAYDSIKNSSKSRNLHRPAFLLGSSDDGAITRTTYRLLKANSLEKIVKNGKPYLRITPAGWDNFCRDFPLFEFQDKPWNGYWSVVNYDIPEKERGVRNSLREKLVSLGFGQWKKSVYISPHDFGGDIRDWVSERELDSYVSVSEARELSFDEKKLVWDVFNLSKISENYDELLKKYKEGKIPVGKILQEY